MNSKDGEPAKVTQVSPVCEDLDLPAEPPPPPPLSPTLPSERHRELGGSGEATVWVTLSGVDYDSRHLAVAASPVVALVVVAVCDVTAQGRVPLWTLLYPLSVVTARATRNYPSSVYVTIAAAMLAYFVARGVLEQHSSVFEHAEVASGAAAVADVACKVGSLAATLVGVLVAQQRPYKNWVQCVDFFDELVSAVKEFDIDAAEQLIEERGPAGSNFDVSLDSLVAHLRLYRPYLPDTLFSTADETFSASDPDMEPTSPMSVQSFDAKRRSTVAEALYPRQKTVVSLPGAIDGSSENRSNDLRQLQGRGSNASRTDRRQTRFSLATHHRRSTMMSAGTRGRSVVSGDWAAAPMSPRSHFPTELPSPAGAYKRRRGTVMVVSSESRLEVDMPSRTTLHCIAKCSRSVRDEAGVVMLMLADSLHGVWNTHAPCPRHAISACRAMLTCRSLQWGNFTVSVACTSLLQIGEVGTSRAMSTFTYGPATNQALQLVSLCVHLGVRMMLSDMTRELVVEVFPTRPVDVVSLPRSTSPAYVYELLQEQPVYGPEFSEAFALFVGGSYAEAGRLLGKMQNENSPGQIERLTRVCQQIEQGTTQLPQPYSRPLIGWVDFEGPEPQRMHAARINSVATTESTDAQPLRKKTSERTWLRDRIRKYQKQNTSAQPRTPITPYSITQAAAAADTPSSEQPNEQPTLTLPARRKQSQSPLQIISSVDLRADPKPMEVTSLMTSFQTCSTDDLVPEALRRRDSRAPLPLEFASISVHGRWRRSEHRMLGRGSFGEVWLGMLEDGALVALKCIPLPHVDEDVVMSPRAAAAEDLSGTMAQQLLSCLSEVNVMSELRHENLVAYVGSSVDSGWVVIAMEYVGGGPLNDLMHQFPNMPMSSVRRYVRDISKGLRHLHKKSVLHRDMKPANVLCAIDGVCKLADFGAAAKLSQLGGGRQIVGTPLYMSPEGANGMCSQAGDIWAVGLICFQLATGKVPYSEEEQQDPYSFYYRLRAGELRPVCPGGLDAQVVSLCTSCWQDKPEDRPTSEQLCALPFLV